MDSHELQALATFVVRCHGADLFAATVRQAKAMAGDRLAFGAVWDRIAAEALYMEKFGQAPAMPKKRKSKKH